MIPQMDDVLGEFATDATLDTYEKQSVDFVETMVKTNSVAIRAVIQPAQRETLQALQVDLTLRYKQVHAAEDIKVGQYIAFAGENYRVITPGDYQLYGFSDVVAAEVKGGIV